MKFAQMLNDIAVFSEVKTLYDAMNKYKDPKMELSIYKYSMGERDCVGHLAHLIAGKTYFLIECYSLRHKCRDQFLGFLHKDNPV